jgi:anti-sigma factor RsiW
MGKKTETTHTKPRADGIVIEISCHEVWKAIGAYVDNDIDADLRRRMEAHFKQCSHCRAVLDGTNNVIQLVGDGQAFDVPAGFSSRLYRKLEERLGTTKKNRE